MSSELVTAVEALLQSVVDLDKKPAAVCAKVKRMLAGDGSAEGGMSPEDAQPVLKKALSAIVALCDEQSGKIKTQQLVLQDAADAPGAGEDLVASASTIAAMAADLDKKSKAVQAKVNKMLGGDMSAADGVAMQKKALAAVASMCADQSGKLKAALGPIREAAETPAASEGPTPMQTPREPAEPAAATPAASASPSAAQSPREAETPAAQASPVPAISNMPTKAAAAAPPTAAAADLPDDVEELQAQLRVSLAGQDGLRAELEQANDDLDAKEGERAAAVARAAEIAEELERVKADASAAFAVEKAELEGRAQEAADARADVQQQLETASSEHADALQTLKDEHAAAAEAAANEAAATLEAVRAEKQAAVDEFQAQLDATKASAAEADAAHDEAITSANASIAALSDKLAAAEAQARTEAEAAALEAAQAIEARAERDAAMVARKRMGDELAVEKNTVASLRAAINRLEEQAATARMQASKAAAAAQVKTRRLDLEIEALKARLVDDHLRVLVRKQQADIDSLRASRVDDAKKLADALAAAERARNERAAVGALGGDTTELEGRLKDQHATLQGLRHDLVDADVRHAKEIRELEAALHQARLDLEDSTRHAAADGAVCDVDEFLNDSGPARKKSAALLLIDNGCQVADMELQRTLLQLRDAEQRSAMLEDELDMVKAELSNRVIELEEQTALAAADHTHVVDTLTGQIKVLQYKLKRSASAAAADVVSPRSASGGGASADSPSRAAALDTEGAAAMAQGRAELERAAAALDAWRKQVDKENATLRLESEMARAKVTSLKRELLRQRDEHELRVKRMEQLHEGQTASLSDQTNLRNSVLGSSSSPSRQRSESQQQQQYAPAAPAGASPAPADPASRSHHAHVDPSISATGRDRSASEATSMRLTRIAELDEELCALHEKSLGLDRRWATERAATEAAIEQAGRDAHLCGATSRYWREQGNEEAAAEEATRAADAAAQRKEKEAALLDLFRQIQQQRQQVLGRSTALMQERTALAEDVNAKLVRSPL